MLILMPARLKNKGASRSKGFSLLEMMLVLAIIGGIIALGLGRVRKRENDIKKVAREFYVLGKELRNQARLKSSTYRLVIQLDEGQQKYWVESAQGFQGRIDEKAEENLREEEKTPEVFQQDTGVIRKEKTLPSGLFFKAVETLDQPPLTTGIARIYFFSSGFVETAALQITDGKNATWTLIYHPLTGQADIIPEERSLRDVKRD